MSILSSNNSSIFQYSIKGLHAKILEAKNYLDKSSDSYWKQRNICKDLSQVRSPFMSYKLTLYNPVLSYLIPENISFSIDVRVYQDLSYEDKVKIIRFKILDNLKLYHGVMLDPRRHNYEQIKFCDVSSIQDYIKDCDFEFPDIVIRKHSEHS